MKAYRTSVKFVMLWASRDKLCVCCDMEVGKNFHLPGSQKQNVGATKVEAFLREHLQLVSNALLLEIRAKEHLSNRRNGCQHDDATACCQEGIQITTEARPQVNDNNQSMEYLHQGLATNHPAQARRMFSAMELNLFWPLTP